LLNLTLIVLQTILPLCDYKVWIDTERGAEVKRHLCNMIELNMMEEEFHARRMVKHKRAAYFVMKREMDREEYKEKREEERA
jgi:polynucleotide 5'-kinase involved in rRNA processing